jgi:hypothetical protein
MEYQANKEATLDILKKDRLLTKMKINAQGSLVKKPETNQPPSKKYGELHRCRSHAHWRQACPDPACDDVD